jgi:predicted transcriptional regulator of viral defense system
MKNSTLGMALAKSLAEKGYRIFDIKVAKEMGANIGIKDAYIKECLFHLKKIEWIVPLKRGLYALTPALLSGNSINEYEIAMAIVTPAAICYWSAFHFHQLTQQTPHQVFVMTIAGTKVPRAFIGKQNKGLISGIPYHILNVKKEHYFGIQKTWYGESEIYVTDLERTLLDGITKPKYCGGFAEVLEAFAIAREKFSLEKLISYAKQLGDSAERRLGWVLENAGISDEMITLLKNNPKGYIKLNASGEKKGKFNKRWRVRENI